MPPASQTPDHATARDTRAEASKNRGHVRTSSRRVGAKRLGEARAPARARRLGPARAANRRRPNRRLL